MRIARTAVITRRKPCLSSWNSSDQIIHDLGGQYTLRWVTLKRSSSSFRPSFTISYSGHSDTYNSSSSYNPTSYAGDVLSGVLRVESTEAGSDEAIVTLRAQYVPRHVRFVQLYVRSKYDFTVELVSQEAGGLCSGWTLLPMEADEELGGYWIRLESSNPQNPFTSIPFGAFGRILQFRVQDISDHEDFLFGEDEAIYVDNSVYAETGGQNFILPGSASTIFPPTFEDGFETGDFSAAAWDSGSWRITSNSSAFGDYAAQSGNISHNQTSTMSLSVACSSECTLSFALRVSSEGCCDKLRLYIDGNLMNEWSGDVDWETVSYGLTSGEHRIQWSYAKDGSVNNGEDAAYIDNVAVSGEVEILE